MIALNHVMQIARALSLLQQQRLVGDTKTP